MHPFTGNIQLNSTKNPIRTSYQDDTHVISVDYDGTTVNSPVRAPEFGSRACPGVHTSDSSYHHHIIWMFALNLVYL